MPADISFTVVGTDGSSLHFDHFAYERSLEASGGDDIDANWVRCRITLDTTTATFRQSVDAQLLTTELTDLSQALKRVLVSPPGRQETFQPTEPFITLRIGKMGTSVHILARLDLAPSLGPVIEFGYECRAEEIAHLIEQIERVSAAFPERSDL